MPEHVVNQFLAIYEIWLFHSKNILLYFPILIFDIVHVIASFDSTPVMRVSGVLIIQTFQSSVKHHAWEPYLVL